MSILWYFSIDFMKPLTSAIINRWKLFKFGIYIYPPIGLNGLCFIYMRNKRNNKCTCDAIPPARCRRHQFHRTKDVYGYYIVAKRIGTFYYSFSSDIEKNTNLHELKKKIKNAQIQYGINLIHTLILRFFYI